MIELLYIIITVVSEMSRELLSKIESGTYGTMKVEGGKRDRSGWGNSPSNSVRYSR